MYSLWSLHIARDENTELGHIDVDYQTEISYEWLSPLFHRELSQSWDFTVPRTPHNESLLLPGNQGVERYPLNDWHAMAYFIGLPWLSDDDAEWGILSVVSTTERRIKVHFVQKNLFFQKIDCPANTISIRKEHGGIYCSLLAETTRARGKAVVSNQWSNAAVALCVVRLMRAVAKQFSYKEEIRDQIPGYLFIVTNILNANIAFSIAANTCSEIREPDGSIESQYWLKRATEETIGDYYTISSDRNLLKLITELSVLCCIHLIVRDKKPGAGTKKEILGIYLYETSADRLFFGELSSYHWLQVEYPLVEDMEKTTTVSYPDENRVTLFPLVSYIDGLGINSRGSDPGRKFCFLNHIEDGHSATYRGLASVYEFYVPFKDKKVANECYFPKSNHDGMSIPSTAELYTSLHTHFGNHSVDGVSCSSSQYRLNYDETYTYLGEYLPTRPVRIKNQRGARMHPIPLARTNFVGQHITEAYQYTPYANTLTDTAKFTSYYQWWSSTNCYQRFYHYNTYVRPWHSKEWLTPSQTYYDAEKFWTYIRNEIAKRTHESEEDEFKTLPTPRNPRTGKGGGGGGGGGKHQDVMRPDNGEMTGYSAPAPHSGILSVRGEYYPTTMYTRGKPAPPKYKEPIESIPFGDDLFIAKGYVYAHLNPPRVCLNVDPYDPTKPRQDKLFLTVYSASEPESKLVDSIAKLGVHHQYQSFKDIYRLSNDVYKELRPVCQRLYKMLSWAVEGPIKSWDEQYVFAHMCEWSYPATGCHAGNQRIKKVSLTLRAGECTIRGVTVVHFNREATDAEFEAACQ